MADAVEPKYSAIYAEIKDGDFTVPAIELRRSIRRFCARTSPTRPKKRRARSWSTPPITISTMWKTAAVQPVTASGSDAKDLSRVTQRLRASKNGQTGYPPKEMIDRRPDLKKVMVDLQSGVGMHGGPSNPLGARAMYLWQGDHDTLFRIHGTNEPWTVGQSQSSGCIRMINQDVMDLYQRTPVGARVVVLASRRAQPAKLGYQSSQNAPSRIGRP